MQDPPSKKRKIKPKCLMCRERPARYIKPVTRDDREEYINGYKEPLFCSIRCAANWSLLFDPIRSGEIYWCKQVGDWKIGSE